MVSPGMLWFRYRPDHRQIRTSNRLASRPYPRSTRVRSLQRRRRDQRLEARGTIATFNASLSSTTGAGGTGPRYRTGEVVVLAVAVALLATETTLFPSQF